MSVPLSPPPLPPRRSEDAAFRASTKAQRRAELERRAVERAEAEDVRLREAAATARRQERESKYNALHALTLQVGLLWL